LPVPNPFDNVLLEIEIKEEDPLFSLKLELISQSSNKFRYGLFDSFSVKDAWSIISFLRFAHYEGDQGFLLLACKQVTEQKMAHFRQQGGKPEDWNPKGQFTGTEFNHSTLLVERNTFKALAKLCLAQLAKFKETLEDDVALFEKDAKERFMTYKERCCCVVRVADKRVLHMWLHLAQQILPLLEDGLSLNQVKEMALKINNPTFT